MENRRSNVEVDDDDGDKDNYDDALGKQLPQKVREVTVNVTQPRGPL